MKDLFIDIREAGDEWKELYGQDMMSVKIAEDYDNGRHYGSILVSEENARILKAAQSLYKALSMYYDMMTDSDVADEAARKALEMAEGKPRPTPRPLPSAPEPSTCETRARNPGPDINADDSACIRCAGSDEQGRPASCVCAQCREEREWARADDLATITRALESARGWVPEKTEDNLLSLIDDAIESLDRLAGKLSGTA